MWGGGEARQVKLYSRATVCLACAQKHQRCKFVPRLFGVISVDICRNPKMWISTSLMRGQWIKRINVVYAM